MLTPSILFSIHSNSDSVRLVLFCRTPVSDLTKMEDWETTVKSRPDLVTRPSYGQSTEPLLEEGREDDRGRGRMSYEGLGVRHEQVRLRHEMRSRSPTGAAAK